MDENKLLDGIIKQAEKDSIEIIRKAEDSAAKRIEAYESSLDRLTAETDQKIEAKLEKMKKLHDSLLKSEERRKRLKLLEEVNQDVKRLFFKKMEKLIGSEEYNDFLAKLIAEGAIAVDDSEVTVNCSFKEEITDSIIESALEYVKKATGRKIDIKYLSKQPLSGQGIIVSSSNGRISYNNQIETRLRRFDEDIKGVISKWMTE